MAVLYVTEQGAVVRKSGRRLLIEKSTEILLDQPIANFDAVVLLGQVQVTAAALNALTDAAIRVSFLSRTGAPRAFVVPEGADAIELRLKQFARFSVEAERLPLARAVVSAKLAASLEVLRRYVRNGDACEPAALGRLATLVDSVASATATANLNGLEGTGARHYFDALMGANKSPFVWAGRKRRPATDPINALLSLGYTLLCGEIRGLVGAAGLEPALGVLHAAEDGRPALALDLMEPYRAPIVDRLTLTLLNRRVLGLADFVPIGKDGEQRLTDDGLRRYLQAYEAWIDAVPGAERPSGPPVNYRDAIRREVARFVAAVRRNEPWVPEAVAV